MTGIQLQSSLHVNRKPVPPNIQAAEQRHVLTVLEALGDGDPQYLDCFEIHMSQIRTRLGNF